MCSVGWGGACRGHGCMWAGRWSPCPVIDLHLPTAHWGREAGEIPQKRPHLCCLEQSLERALESSWALRLQIIFLFYNLVSHSLWTLRPAQPLALRSFNLGGSALWF